MYISTPPHDNCAYFYFSIKIKIGGVVLGRLKNKGVYDKIMSGRVAEWLKAHDSKSCGLVDSLGGSNPLSSATS